MSKKETIKSVEEKFKAWRLAAKDYIFGLRNPATRRLLTVDVADVQGKLNGMTIVELLTIVNLTNGTEEYIRLTAEGKKLVIWAVHYHPQTPEVLQ